jgi:hypothetical protein
MATIGHMQLQQQLLPTSCRCHYRAVFARLFRGMDLLPIYITNDWFYGSSGKRKNVDHLRRPKNMAVSFARGETNANTV